MPGPEPRMDIPGKLIIRTYAPVRRWLVLLVLALLVVLSLYLAYELGHYEAGFDGIEAAQERSALQGRITYYTTVSGARAACVGMQHLEELRPYDLQGLHATLH